MKVRRLDVPNKDDLVSYRKVMDFDFVQIMSLYPYITTYIQLLTNIA